MQTGELNWRAVTDNPNDGQAMLNMGKELAQRTVIFNMEKIELVKNFSHGKRVLDIGAAGHVVADGLDRWPHQQICTVAQVVHGIDIEEDKCEYYNSLGYSFFLVDATSEQYLGSKYQVVNCGDVIEHVDNPVKLLQFISRHLYEDGGAILSTPNPFYDGFAKLRQARGEIFYTANMQHITWITPSNMQEICWRAGLELKNIYIPKQALDVAQVNGKSVETMFHEYIYYVTKRMG